MNMSVDADTMLVLFFVFLINLDDAIVGMQPLY